MPELGDTQTFWAIDYDNLEDGPFEVEATFTRSETPLGGVSYFWKLDDDVVYANAQGEPMDTLRFAATQREGYAHAIQAVKNLIRYHEEMIGWLASQRDAVED